MRSGFSMYDFQTFENLATVAPSTTLWSADQDTFKIVVGVTTAFPLRTRQNEGDGEEKQQVKHRKQTYSSISSNVAAAPCWFK
jgi:hypothetical protein